MKVIDKVVDKALKPEEAKTEQVLQEDYNKLLETAKILEAENEYLRDSLATQPEEIRKRTDSAIYSETKPYINQLYKNRKR